jgi:hypothetical protein
MCYHVKSCNAWLFSHRVWDVDIHSDNYVHFLNRPAKTGSLKRAVLFQAGCACWILGRAFCVATSWLAAGENWGPVKGRFVFSFQQSRR